jgi:hypothetical protein
LERAAIPRPSLEKYALQSPDTKSKGALTVRFNAIVDLDGPLFKNVSPRLPGQKSNSRHKED